MSNDVSLNVAEKQNIVEFDEEKFLNEASPQVLSVMLQRSKDIMAKNDIIISKNQSNILLSFL